VEAKNVRDQRCPQMRRRPNDTTVVKRREFFMNQSQGAEFDWQSISLHQENLSIITI